MKTVKPISTISYDSISDLIKKCDNLITEKKIDNYFFVLHRAECDETKDHIHLYLDGIQKKDTDLIRTQLMNNSISSNGEIIKNYSCMPFRTSNFHDAYLYFTHNCDYLACKGQKREYHYTLENVITNDHDWLIDLTHQIDYSKIKNSTADILTRIDNGEDLFSLVIDGTIRLNQFKSLCDLYSFVTAEKLYRSNGGIHDPKKP